MIPYRLKIVLLALGAACGFGSGVAHLARGPHHHAHCAWLWAEDVPPHKPAPERVH